MWIKQDKYKQLEESRNKYEKYYNELFIKYHQMETDQDALVKEILRLKDIINAKVEECQVGPWCDGCIHLGEEKAYQDNKNYNSRWFYGCDAELGYVKFCKKHLHELCPEFEVMPTMI